jgi:hypothetical protein
MNASSSTMHVIATPIEALEDAESKKTILELLEGPGHHPGRNSALVNKQKVKNTYST